MPHAMNDVILQNETKELYHDYQEYLQFQHLYQAAVQSIQMRLEVLNEEFSVKYAASPIHHIESRVKSTKSIIEKLKRKNCEISMASAKEHVNDIAGIRVVCNYIDDVYSVEQMLLRQTDMELIKRQDYIAEPNYNGYRSLHLDMRVPIFLSDHTEYVLAEIQIRSVPWISGPVWSTICAIKRTRRRCLWASTRRCFSAPMKLRPLTGKCRICTIGSAAPNNMRITPHLRRRYFAQAGAMLRGNPWHKHICAG